MTTLGMRYLTLMPLRMNRRTFVDETSLRTVCSTCVRKGQTDKRQQSEGRGRTMWMLWRYSASGERECTDDDEKMVWSSSLSARSMM